MQTIPRLCGVVILSMVAASCGGNPDDEAVRDEGAPAAAAALPVGTAGEQAAAAESAPASPTAPGELPGTAGSMTLVGGLGVLLVGGGIMLRYIRRQ